MGTKNNPGQFDCYDPNEPMFVLLARDPSAPMLVRLWAHIRSQRGGDEAKVKEAETCANAMVAWQSEERSEPESAPESGVRERARKWTPKLAMGPGY